MSEFQVNGRSLQAQVVKLHPQTEEKALKGLGQDGHDNVVFALGADTFVASARELNLKGLKEHQLVQYKGQTGRVLQLDEGMSLVSPKKGAIGGALVGLVGMPLTALGLGALFGSAMGFMGLLGMAGAGAVIFAGLGAGLAAVNGWLEGRKAKKADWTQYGQVQG